MAVQFLKESIPNLYNGVSQQPDHIRFPSQCEEQINGYASIVDGLQKRPPRKHIAKLSNSVLTNPFVHFINRDINERYVVIITSGNIDVFDLSGNEKTVNTPDGVDYITNADPKENFRALTIVDHTFILNKTKTVAMDSATTTAAENAALVVVKSSVEGIYRVFIEGVSYTYTAANGAALSSIAGGLATEIGAGPGGNYTVTRNQNVLKIVKNTAGSFTINVTSPHAATTMTLFKDKAQRFSDLPSIAPKDYVIEVVGDNSSNFDNYYVKFVTKDDSSFNEGYWVETVAPGIKYKLDSTTMPYKLVRESDGTFTFSKNTWGNRTSGDEESAPDPSFVGKTLSDIFLFKNRLGFLSGENIILSQSGGFYNFFPETVLNILDSDPIDVTASHTKVSLLNYAVPYDEDLFLFSNYTQFRLDSGGDILSLKTVEVVPVTEFESSGIARPVATNQNIYFSINSGNYSHIYEYFVSDVNDTKDAANITAAVPKYIPKNVRLIIESSSLNLLFALTDEDPNTLYLYQYFWQKGSEGPVKLQSAWSKWEFDEGCTILGGQFIDSVLYLVTQYSDGVYLESVDFSSQNDTGFNYINLLDRRLTESQCSVAYDSLTDETTFTLPYNIQSGVTMRVIARSGGSSTAGRVLTVKSQGTNTVVISGDFSSQPVFIGQLYEFKYKFSQLYKRVQSNSTGQIALTEGRTQLKGMQLNFVDSGYFLVKITPDYRDPKEYKYAGRLLGSGNNKIGQVPIDSGVFKFPILSKNTQIVIEILNPSHLPCKFTSASWTGVFIPS